MMVRLIAAKTAAFTTLALLGALVPAASAQASTTALGDCPSGHFCAWADDDYSGARAQWAGNDDNWSDEGMHDNAESMYNNGEPGVDLVAIYYDIKYGEYAFCMDRGESIDVWMDDNDYSSHAWASSC